GCALPAVLERANDPSPRVRCQAALTLGASDRPEVAAALAGIAVRDGADPWAQTAVLSSAARCAPDLLRALVGDREFLAAPHGPAFLARLAAVMGAKADDTELSLPRDLRGRAPPGAAWPAAVLGGLGQGLRQSGKRVRLWDDPPAKLKESVAAVRPLFDR